MLAVHFLLRFIWEHMYTVSGFQQQQSNRQAEERSLEASVEGSWGADHEGSPKISLPTNSFNRSEV